MSVGVSAMSSREQRGILGSLFVPVESAWPAPSASFVGWSQSLISLGFSSIYALRRQAIKNGVEQGHRTQPNRLGMKDLWPSASRSALTAIASSERPGGPLRTGKPTIPSLVQTFRGPKHHEPARPPCPQSSGTCRQGLAGSGGPRARREQPVGSLARSSAAAQTGQRDIDPASVAESCSQRRHRGRCADAPSWCTDSRSVLAVTWAKAWAVPRA